MYSKPGREWAWFGDDMWGGDFMSLICLDSSSLVCVFRDGHVSMLHGSSFGLQF